MVAQVFCLTAGSGLPLFVRKKGDADPLSFSQIASLNGVHLFAKSHGVAIENTIGKECVIVWKEFQESIMLIGLASGVSPEILTKFLKLVFKAMVLCLGIDEITAIRNPERLKRDLRVTFRLIDKLLEGLETGDKTQIRNDNPSFKLASGDINDFVEVILCQENQSLQSCLESYVETVESLYGCISIHGKLAVATPSWWELEQEEKKLLNILISVLNVNCTSSDVPIFLPDKSPSVPFRLVTLRLINGVDISILCGPTPPLGEMEQNLLQIWRPMIEILRSAEKTFPRNFPSIITLDANILGFLLINDVIGKYLISRNLNKKESCLLSGSHRLGVLRTFYYQSVSVFLIPKKESQVKGAQGGESESFRDKEKYNFPALETYWCSEYHKCHALRSGDNVMCVLYSASVPTPTMRILTKQCLKVLTSEKHFCW